MSGRGGAEEFEEAVEDEEDDKEADDVYQSVADHMSERRKDRKEDLEKQRVELLDREHMDVKRQFEDLKVLFHLIVLL